MLNSVGGVTYLRNRYCQIVARERVVPTNPNTSYQQTVRANLSAAVSAWKSLSNEQRNSWESFASATPWQNSLGDPQPLTGQAIYISIRLANIYADPTLPSSTWDQPPNIPGLLSQPYVSYQLCDPSIPPSYGQKIVIHNLSAIHTVKFSIFFAGPFSPSINWYKGPYDPTQHTLSKSTPPGQTYLYVRCDLIQDQKYFLKIRSLLSPAHNNISTETYTSFIAQPSP